LILTVILFPFAFFSNKNHHEESGYDLWNILFIKWTMILI
jgi:hypothetical protein